MRSRVGRLLLGNAVAVILAGAATLAQTTGLSVVYPNYPKTGSPLLSCDPATDPSANTIQISGIPENSSVTVIFTWANPYGGSPLYQPPLNFNNVAGGTLDVPVSYPADTASWPYVDTTTNVREIQVNALIMVNTGSTTLKATTRGWWVRCTPPPTTEQGCTPGYWRQEHHFDSWTGYAPADDFNGVFGVTASFNPHTLLDAVWLGGGGEYALARHAVAALLDAANPAVSYLYSEGQVVAMVQAAYASGDFETTKNLFAAANEAGCPLN